MSDIVYLTVDSLRADHVGWHGYHRETTPFLDTLADRAHVFTQAFSNGSYTRRAFPSMMVSEYPTLALENGGLAAGYETVANALSNTGYETAGFHSNAHLLPQFGYARGFDTFYDSMSEPTRLAKLRQWVKHNVPNDSFVYKFLETLYIKSEESVGFNPGKPHVSAREITDRAIEWVETAGEGPRFLWVHYMDPHHPYNPPEQYQLEFRDKPVSERRAMKLRRKLINSPTDITNDERKELIDLYDAEIRFFDVEVERLVDVIRENWGDDVIITFTSDHGEEFGDHGDFGHGHTLYDELLHVPLIVDRGDDGATHNDVVSLIDMPPTFVNVAGGNNPDSFRGRSLVPILDGERRSNAYALGDGAETVSYRDESWKYITDPAGAELYDVQADPTEQTNVVDHHPNVVAEIESILDEYPELGAGTEVDIDKEALDSVVQDRLEQLGYLQE